MKVNISIPRRELAKATGKSTKVIKGEEHSLARLIAEAIHKILLKEGS